MDEASIVDRLPPTTRRVYLALREEIRTGTLPTGAKLPAFDELATGYGVSPVTMRKALLALQDAGYLSVEPGRGTFVQPIARPSVLIVDDDPLQRTLLREYVEARGYQALEAEGPEDGLSALESASNVALVLSDVRMPQKEAGVEFIRTVRRRWQHLPLAAVTAHPNDLLELHGTPECPILILPKPVRAAQVEEALDLTVGRAAS